MKLTRLAPYALGVVALAFTGCAAAARIQAPSAPMAERATTNECYRVFRVKFHHQLDPATFRASIDGNDITPLFPPPYTPGGTSAAAIPFPFTGGQQSAGPGVFIHKFRTDGRCVAPYMCTMDEIEFVPLHLHGKVYSPIAGSTNFAAGTQVQADVIAAHIPTAPVQVELKPSGNVALYNPNTGVWNPGGQPISLTIPTSNDRASFMMRGSPGSYDVLFRAVGCEQGAISGWIN